MRERNWICRFIVSVLLVILAFSLSGPLDFLDELFKSFASKRGWNGVYFEHSICILFIVLSTMNSMKWGLSYSTSTNKFNISLRMALDTWMPKCVLHIIIIAFGYLLQLFDNISEMLERVTQGFSELFQLCHTKRRNLNILLLLWQEHARIHTNGHVMPCHYRWL